MSPITGAGGRGMIAEARRTAGSSTLAQARSSEAAIVEKLAREMLEQAVGREALAR